MPPRTRHDFHRKTTSDDGSDEPFSATVSLSLSLEGSIVARTH
jgi:hypothetical protein